MNIQNKAKRKKFVKQSVVSNGQMPEKYLMDHLNSPLSIYDSNKKKFIYFNPQFIQMTGLKANELYTVELDEYLKRIHAKDLLVVLNEVASKVRVICSEYISRKKQQLMYTINYRFKQKDGNYIHVMVQNTVLEWNNEKQRSVALNQYTDITHHKKDHKIILTINVCNPGNNDWKMILTEEFLNTPEMLSEREQEVMQLIVKENTAGEIARKLGLKFYTVRAHWRNILSKTGCKSQKELKEMAVKEGWV